MSKVSLCDSLSLSLSLSFPLSFSLCLSVSHFLSCLCFVLLFIFILILSPPSLSILFSAMFCSHLLSLLLLFSSLVSPLSRFLDVSFFLVPCAASETKRLVGLCFHSLRVSYRLKRRSFFTASPLLCSPDILTKWIGTCRNLGGACVCVCVCVCMCVHVCACARVCDAVELLCRL